MRFADEGLKSGYYLALSERLFKFALKYATALFVFIYWSNFYAPQMGAGAAFGVAFAAVFVVLAMALPMLPLREGWLAELELYKEPPDVSKARAAMLEKARIELAKRPGAREGETIADNEIFATVASDDYVAYPAWFGLAAALLAFEYAAVRAACSVKMPVVGMTIYKAAGAAQAEGMLPGAAVDAGVQALYGVALFTVVLFVMAWRCSSSVVGAPGSIGSGFAPMFIGYFAARSAVLWHAAGSGCIWRTAMLGFAAALALVLAARLAASRRGGAYYHAFARTADRSIYYLRFTRSLDLTGEMEKLPFSSRARFYKTPFATALAVEDETGRLSPEAFYYLGNDKSRMERAVAVFCDRLAVAGDFREKRDIVSLFEPYGIGRLAGLHGRSQTLVTLAALAAAFLIVKNV